MIDFLFAVIAAGVNSAGGDGNNTEIVAAPAPAAVTAPADTTIAAAPTITAPTVAAPTITAPTISSPTVIIGESAVLGSSVIIGGASLLDGTAEEAQPTAPLAAAPAAPAAPAPAAVVAVAPPAPATAEFNMAVVPAGLVAEPQTPTGKFTTAAEVKPILNATKGNWVAVREYDGKDLLYVTHLWGWRCGLSAMAISVNGEPMQNWPLPACHMKYATPNAMLEEDGLPYLSLRLGAVQTIDIQIVYDDLSMDKASFERGNVLIP